MTQYSNVVWIYIKRCLTFWFTLRSLRLSDIISAKTKFSERLCDDNHMQKATMHLVDNLESKSVRNATHNHTQPTWPDCGESDWKGKTVQCRFSSTLLAMLTDHSAAIGDDTPRAEQTELNCLWQDASSVEAVLIFMAGLHYGDLKPGREKETSRSGRKMQRTWPLWRTMDAVNCFW